MEVGNNILSDNFLRKKATILEALATPADTYTDKSPKGSVDAPIINLIDELNAIDGLVTTSSCSGRVAVFVEGSHSGIEQRPEDDAGISDESSPSTTTGKPGDPEKKVKTGPGGKGGGRWLYVSHDPVKTPTSDTTEDYFTRLCGLERAAISTSSSPSSAASTVENHGVHQSSSTSAPRLIRLSFSPLILHILTADLATHARPLLSAAINAGFRESGVQSLAALDSSSQKPASLTGTMLAIRTAGLAFETIIGRVEIERDNQGHDKEVMKALVDERYLELCFGVINERFRWNTDRTERLRAEIELVFAAAKSKAAWESKADRRQRKKEEGLLKQRKKQQEHSNQETFLDEMGFEQLDDGLGLSMDTP